MLAMLSHKIKYQTITIRKINQNHVFYMMRFLRQSIIQWQNAYKILLLLMIFD